MELLTHSKRQAWQNCRRYYLHKHIHHLQPRIQRTGRRRGSIFGNTIASVADTAAMSPELQFDVDADARRAFIYEVVGNQYDLLRESGILDGDAYAELDVEEVKVAVMVECYVDHYGIDPRREMEFNIPLVNPRTGRASRAFRIAGKIDGLARTWKRPDGTNVAVIIEDKLVQSIQKAMILRLPLDAQSTEYVDAFISKGWDCMISYRHTRFSSANPLPAKEFKTKDNYPGETLDEFGDRLREKVEAEPASFFDQQELYFPTEHLDDYRAGRWGIAQQILAARKTANTSREEENFPMNSSRCWEYGGCEFIPLCTKQEGASALYQIEVDNPELQTGRDETIVSEYVA